MEDYHYAEFQRELTAAKQRKLVAPAPSCTDIVARDQPAGVCGTLAVHGGLDMATCTHIVGGGVSGKLPTRKLDSGKLLEHLPMSVERFSSSLGSTSVKAMSKSVDEKPLLPIA